MQKHPHINKLFAASAIIALVGVTLFVVVDRHDGVAPPAEANQESQHRSASVGDLIGGLKTRLADNPEDAKGWLLLARSHEHLGDNAEAWNAYSRARELGLTDNALELKLAASVAATFDE